MTASFKVGDLVFSYADNLGLIVGTRIYEHLDIIYYDIDFYNKSGTIDEAKGMTHEVTSNLRQRFLDNYENKFKCR
jgi:hypothetical protein